MLKKKKLKHFELLNLHRSHALTLQIRRMKNSFAIITNFIKCNYQERIFVSHQIIFFRSSFSVSRLDDAIATSSEIYFFALFKTKKLLILIIILEKKIALLFICLFDTFLIDSDKHHIYC